jgi:biopolymer transport protein ExbD
MALGQVPGMGGDDEGGGSDGVFAEINITPLTDIFLVLLIIFMVSSSVMVETASRAGVKVNLPKGANQEIDPGAKSLIVSVTTAGEILVQGQVVKADDLDNLFMSAAAKDEATQVIIEADTTVDHGVVVGIMERAKRAGLSKLAIATKGGK